MWLRNIGRRLRNQQRHLATVTKVAAHRLRHGDEPIYSSDWMTRHCENWLAALRGRENDPLQILEIGSFEGRSARFFLDTFPLARITCVDLFTPKRNAWFDHNLKPHRRRLTKLAGRSAAILDKLVVNDLRYDVIYIDGHHGRSSVFVDSALAWPLLNIGGILIWDDYLLDVDKPSHARPQHAIDVFCQTFASCLRELHRGEQVIVEKTADWPMPKTALVAIDREAEIQPSLATAAITA
jgi:predicted O-methyltransferase YrrM